MNISALLLVLARPILVPALISNSIATASLTSSGLQPSTRTRKA